MFFIRQKKIVLDCFTNEKSVFNYAKIDYANNFYPKWLKNIDKSYEDGIKTTSTIKKCEGLLQTYQHGFIIPLWCDLVINIENRSYNWQFADFKTEIEVHSSKQWDYFADPTKHGHIKIVTPWQIETKNKVYFSYIAPYWNLNLNDNFSIPSGIVEYKYQHGTNINIFLNLLEDRKIHIDFGTPMAHVIPISEKNIELRHHLVDDKEYKNKTSILKFNNQYNTKKKLDQKIEKSKCPFHK